MCLCLSVCLAQLLVNQHSTVGAPARDRSWLHALPADLGQGPRLHQPRLLQIENGTVPVQLVLVSARFTNSGPTNKLIQTQKLALHLSDIHRFFLVSIS